MGGLEIKRYAKQALWTVSENLFHALTKPHPGQIFSIGIYTGASPLSLHPGRIANPVLDREDVTDVPAAFVADPFMLRHAGHWYMFFEVFNRITHRGEIAVATSANGFDWTYERVVIREPFHLAYPHVIESNGRFFLIPDSPCGGIRLYEAVQFPYQWRQLDFLVNGDLFSDSTVFEYDGTWWMLTAWAASRSHRKSLRLFCAETLQGEWVEHPASPVAECDERATRPAGRVRILDGRPVRFAQDGVLAYGHSVHAFEVLELTSSTYRERELIGASVLDPARAQWNAGGMHHVDAHALDDGSWIACVDGWYNA